MALLNAGDFTGPSDNYAIPSGVPDPVFIGSVDIILSTGITQQVFDSLSIALKCTHYMEQQRIYSLSPNEDITILNLRSKLLILENAYIHQEMMNSYVFTYHGAEVKAIHRSMADMVSLPEALLLDLDVLDCLGTVIPTLSLKLTGPIKTDLVFKLWSIYTSILLFHTLI